MYKEHHIFEKPENEHAKIWRYIDFAKFVSMLDKKALLFSRADKLGDPFEGSYPNANVILRKEELEAANLPVNKVSKFMGVNLKRFVRSALVSCWCLSEYESAALWTLYTKSDKGIAISSTFHCLKTSFGNGSPDIYISKVKYIDYQKDLFPTKNPLYPLICKRKSFEFEQELRAVTLQSPRSDHSRYITVDLDTLIQKIYVAPTSPKWFYKLVKSIMEKYELDKDVLQSNLDENPIF